MFQTIAAHFCFFLRPEHVLSMCLRSLTEMCVCNVMRLNVAIVAVRDVTERKGLRVLGIKPKAIAAADQFLLNRILSSTQIVGNRHVMAIEFMLQTIVRAFAKENDLGKDSLGKPELSNEMRQDYRLKRILDGLAVVNDDGKPTMLIDHESSLFKKIQDRHMLSCGNTTLHKRSKR
jgi:HD superfamily phosphohydrolase